MADSDDDDFVCTPGPSKRKKTRTISPKKRPKKLSQSVSAPDLDRSRKKLSAEYCVNCQMPFDLLHRWESVEVHASTCLETDFASLPDCPDGQGCDNTIRSHFTKFNHVALASFRDLGRSSHVVERSQLPKFVFKKSDPKVSSTDDSSIKIITESTRISDVADETRMSKEPKVGKESSEEAFETALLDQTTNVFSDDDDLFEELTNRALEIDAVKSPEGAIEIQVKVDPNVKLESLVMKIPSPSEASQIDVVGRINSNRKQGTLDSFFGLKTSSKTVSEATSARFANHHRGDSLKSDGISDQNGVKKQRVCPFYKKIPDTSFTVDAFSYGQVPGVTHYFLSHFHYDHYSGMTKSWNLPVVCSPITAKLILLKIRMDKSHLTVINLNQPYVINKVEITLLDANHCPGSVMFLFKVTSSLILAAKKPVTYY